MEMMDHVFRRDRYEDPQLLREGIFQDRKSEIYPIYDKDHLDADGNSDWPRKLSDYIKDVVALANMSYRYGKVARILFGVDDRHHLLGVLNQGTRQGHLANVNYKNRDDVEQRFKEIVRDFRSAFRKYVSPKTIEMQVQWDNVGDATSILVAYLEIQAHTSNSEPYHITGELPPDSGIKVGQSWRREGENNALLEGEEYDNWFSYDKCPTVPAEQWTGYFNRLQGGEFAAAANISGYQPPLTSDRRWLKKVVDEFLSTPDARILVIEGAAGMGKTQFLRRIVHDFAAQAMVYLDGLTDDRLPGAWLPIDCELANERIGKEFKLDWHVMRWWNREGFFLPELPQSAGQLLKRTDARWILLLDALDELWKPKWIDNLRIAIREFIDDYPRVKVIITSRPDALTPAWRNLGMVVSMADLRDDQVANFLASNLAEDDFSAAVRFRQDNDEIAALTRKPLYLAAFVKGIRPDFTEDAELHEPTVTAAEAPITLPPSLPAGSIGLAAFVQEHSPDFDAPGPEINLQQEQITDESPDLPDPTISRSSVLARMIERIWQHDQKHFREAKSTLSETEALDALMRLAAEVDGQNLFTYERARIRKRKYALNRFLSLGLLDQLPEGLTFPCRTLQYYMAAERLWRLWRLGKKRRFCKLVSSSDSFWRTVYEFFTEIAYEQLAEEHYKQCLASQG